MSVPTTLAEVTQGEDLTYDLTVRDKNGAVVDITGYQVRFQVRHKTADAAANAMISKTSAVSTEIDIYDPVNGKARIFIDPSDTLAAAKFKPGDYYYDVWVVTTASKQHQIIRASTFRVNHRVTVI